MSHRELSGPTVSRRRLLTGSAAAGALAALGIFEAGPAHADVARQANTASAGAASAATDDAFAALRARWLTVTAGGVTDASDPSFSAALTGLNSAASSALSALDGSVGRTAVYADLPLGTVSANVTTSFDRLKNVALAVATPGTEYTGDATATAAVLDGLDFLVANAYGPAAGESGAMHGYDNWWDWQIGSPQRLEDIAVMLYDSISDDQLAGYCDAIDHFVPDPTSQQAIAGPHPSTGANRLDLCRVVIVRGALAADQTGIQNGVAAISPTLAIVPSGDGLHSDNGWIQHTSDGVGVAYMGTYGEVWLKDLALLLTALAGSPWTISDPNIANVYDAALHGFAPFIYNGVMLDSVRGRAIARPGERGADDGLSAATDMIMLANGSDDPSTASQLRSAVKGWLQRSPKPIEQTGSILKIQLAKTLLDDASVHAAGEPNAHTIFPSMDRAVHRRPGWAFSIGMSSDRIAYYENGGGDNLRGWHTGDGMTEIFLADDAGHYDDDFWPTVDPYRLPGITASLLPLQDGQGGTYATVHPNSAWVGGATDGEYAAIGQDLQGPFSTLRAHKSWFCLDDTVVCVGSDIAAADDTEVDTVVDNRILTKPTAVRVNGRVAAASGPTTGRARWASIEGQSAYVFPDTAGLTVLRESRTGSWSDISTGASGMDPVTRDYATLYLDHGTNPSGAGYTYLVLPGATDAQAAARARRREWLSVVERSARAHAIAVASLGVTAANFWQPAHVRGLSSSAPVSVLIREDRRSRTATIAVSDPSRSVTSARITWSRHVRSVIDSSSSLTASKAGHELSLSFGDLSALQGASQVVKVRLA